MVMSTLTVPLVRWKSLEMRTKFDRTKHERSFHNAITISHRFINKDYYYARNKVRSRVCDNT
jgi:hypothetical protein